MFEPTDKELEECEDDEDREVVVRKAKKKQNAVCIVVIGLAVTAIATVALNEPAAAGAALVKGLVGTFAVAAGYYGVA